MVAIGKALAHLKYIRHRPGPDRERGGREMFNERDDVDAQQMREAIRELEDSRVVIHKLTLAPEINPEDKKAFTREVMENLSRDLGRDLEWLGVIHNNTEHHHIHVVVLGKDRNGTDVRIDLRDIDKVKEYGDRYLERWHPKELERSRREREGRERERRLERRREWDRAREQRIHEGLELPWLHQKLVREQLEPFDKWKEKQRQDDEERARGRRDDQERPYYQDTIEAAGRQWSKENNLKELRDLNEYLWDNIDERLPKDEYKKLAGWIKDKERLKDDSRETKNEQRQDDLEWHGQTYSRKDSYEKLTGLVSDLRDSNDRLPFDDYQRLRGWIEYKDHERFSGALEKEIERAHERFEHSGAEGGRVIDPLQQELMKNPVMGLFMTEAAIASEIVRSIPLDDRDKDYLKELRDELVGIKRDIEWRETTRMPWEFRKNNPDLERIEKAIEDVERKREQALKREKERGRDDWDRFDPWGRF